MGLWKKIKNFFSSRKKKRKTIGTSVQRVSKPKQTKVYRSSGTNKVGTTEKKTVSKAVGYTPSKKVQTSVTRQKENRISVADVMGGKKYTPTKAVKAKVDEKAKKKSTTVSTPKKYENNKGLTDREKALKRRVDTATHAISNRAGKDFMKDVKSGIYTTKATEKEKKNVAKSIERDYNKKSKAQKAVAGFTKSDANVKIATKAITGKDINTDKVTKSKQYKAGDIAQEVASYAIAPTGAVEKGLAKAGAKALAKKTLKKEGKELTSKAIKKATKTATKQLAKNKGRTFARKRAADVIANAPFNAKYAASRASEDGEFDKKEFAKDLASNTVLDVGIGGGIDAIAGRKGRALAREAKLSKSLEKRVQKVTKQSKGNKSEWRSVGQRKGAVNKKEVNYGEAVKKEYEGIDRRRELGKISKGEAKRQRKALAKVVERESGKRGVVTRSADGLKRQRVTAKGLEDITDNYADRLTFDKRFKGKAKSIGRKAIREQMAKQPKGVKANAKVERLKRKIDEKANWKDLTAEEKKVVREEAEQAERKETARSAYNKERQPLDKYDLEERDNMVSRDDKARFGKTEKERQADETRLAKSQPKSKTAKAKAAQRTRGVSQRYGIPHGVTENKNEALTKALDDYVKDGDDSKLYKAVREELPDAAYARKKVKTKMYDLRTKAGKKAKANGEKQYKISYDVTTNRDIGMSENDLDDMAETVVEDYKDALATANPKAEEPKFKRKKSKLADTDKVTDESPSAQEVYDLFKQKQPKGKKVKGVPERIQKRIDRTADDTAQDAQSNFTAEKNAEPKNESVSAEKTLKNAENKTEEKPEMGVDEARKILKDSYDAAEQEAKEAGKLNTSGEKSYITKLDREVTEEDDPLIGLVNEATERTPGIHLPGADNVTAKSQKYLDDVAAEKAKAEEAEGVLYDNAKELAEEQQPLKADASPTEVKTEVATEGGDPAVNSHVSKREKQSGIAVLNSFASDARRKLINSMGFSEDQALKYAKDNGDEAFEKTFRGNVNNLRQSVQRAIHSLTEEQQDYHGRLVGDSAKKILRDIISKGKAHYNNVQSYLYLLNHADRLDSATGKRMGELIEQYKAVKNRGERYGYTEEITKQLDKLSEQMDTLENEGITGLTANGANKRLFNDMTAQEARERAAALLAKDKDLAKDADRIVRYFRNDLRSQVQAGLISKETMEHYIKQYPNYVPAHRVPYEKSAFSVSGNPLTVNPGSLRAKGSDLDVLPIEDQMKMSTEYTFTRGAQNEVSKQIAKMSGYDPRFLDLYDEADTVNAIDLATFYDFDNGKLQFWDNGKMKEVKVDKRFLKDLKDMQVNAPTGEFLKVAAGLTGKVNRAFKALITSYNPAFMIKNAFRDAPEGLFQSANTPQYFTNWISGRGVASILANDDYFKAYKRMGGKHSQFINGAEDIIKSSKVWKKPLDAIEWLNELAEQAPRMAEFIGFLEKRGKTATTATADELRQAAEAAADVTVNFGRSGSIGRIINSSLVPFFNPAMQGWSKIARVMTRDKTASGYMNLIGKGAMLGVAPEVLNELIIGDNENYQLLNERDRAVNYYIPLDADNPLNKLFGSDENGTKDGEVFLKIPKARFLSVIAMGTQKATGANDMPFADIVAISKSQIAPVGMENNIFQQFKNSAITNDDDAGKTWYGATIENMSDKQNKPKDRYNENTSDLAIWLGQKTGKSPKKIDYLIDSYTGVAGDIIMSKKKASQRGFWAKNFSTDSVSQNNLSTKMYERIDKLTQEKGSGDTSEKTDYGLHYLTKRSTAASEIRKEISEIQNSDKSKKQKAKEIRPLQRELNKIIKTGMDTEDEYVKAAKKYIGNLDDTTLKDKTKRTYGLETAMIATAKDRGDDPWKLVEKAFSTSKAKKETLKYAKEAGIDPVAYKEFYNKREFDLDGSGGMPSKREATTYLNSRDDLTAQQKAILYHGFGGWLAKGTNPYGSLEVDSGTKTASSSGRRSGGRRRSSRRSSSSRKTTPKKIAAPTALKQTKVNELVSVADVMKNGNKATASALANILRKSSSADYEAAAKSVQKKNKYKNIYKMG